MGSWICGIPRFGVLQGPRSLLRPDGTSRPPGGSQGTEGIFCGEKFFRCYFVGDGCESVLFLFLFLFVLFYIVLFFLICSTALLIISV